MSKFCNICGVFWTESCDEMEHKIHRKKELEKEIEELQQHLEELVEEYENL